MCEWVYAGVSFTGQDAQSEFNLPEINLKPFFERFSTLSRHTAAFSVT